MDLSRHFTKEDIQINGQSAHRMTLGVFISRQGKAHQSHWVPISHPRQQVLGITYASGHSCSLMKRQDQKKKWSPHAMECYSAVKRNAVSIHGTACWPLKMLCYVKEERHKASMMCEFTYQNVQNRQIHRDRSKDVRITESLAVHLKLIQHCRSTICELKHIFS